MFIQTRTRASEWSGQVLFFVVEGKQQRGRVWGRKCDGIHRQSSRKPIKGLIIHGCGEAYAPAARRVEYEMTEHAGWCAVRDAIPARETVGKGNG